jgi:hypothetical protein
MDTTTGKTEPCYICGYAEHAPTPEHNYWSTSDALREFASEPTGQYPSMSAVETLDPREAIYS